MLAAFGLIAPLPAAEEAWRDDGRRVSGALTLEGGRLLFKPTEGRAVALAEFVRVRFADAAPPPFRAVDLRRVRLRDGQHITGQILALDEETLTVRTGWAARAALPRAAVESIDPLPGWRTVATDDFHDGPKSFTTTGDPPLEDAEPEAGARSVLLRSAAQSVAYTSAQPLSAGRVGVNFAARGRPAGARWTFELRFQDGERTRRVAVTVAGEGDHYPVDVGGLEGTGRQVRRTPGWHRLEAQFSSRSLRLTCDDEVLWYNLDEGPGGRLKQVTMRCQQGPGGTEAEGAVAWGEFCVERAVVEHPKPPADPGQDEVRLADDDQLFGRILGADRRTIRMEGRFGKRSLPWATVAGCSFRRPDSVPKSNGGPDVRLLLRSGAGADPDVLDGVVTALDERRLNLRHALLGELTLDRGRVRELRPLTGGRR